MPTVPVRRPLLLLAIASLATGPLASAIPGLGLPVDPSPLTDATVAFADVDVGAQPECHRPGCTAWVERFNGPGSADDRGQHLARSPDGATAYVAGHTSWPNVDLLVVAFDVATGDVLWNVTWDGGKGDDKPAGIAMGPDGASVLVAGWAHGATSGYDLAAWSFDAATGDLRWAASHDSGAGDDYGRGLAVAPDGRTVFVAGEQWTPLSNLDGLVVAFDLATGGELWAVAQDAAGLDDAARAVVADASAVYVAGDAEHLDGEWDYRVQALDHDGAELWTAVYDGAVPGDDQVVGLALGDVLAVAGHSWNGTGPRHDVLALGLDPATGATLWTTRWDGTGVDEDWARAIAVAPNGAAFYVAAQSWSSPGAWDMVALRVDADGTHAWVARHPTAGTENPNDVAVSPDGATVALVGYGSGTGDDLLLTGIAAGDGALLHTTRHNGPANSHDYGNDVELTASGHALVAASSVGVSTSYDAVLASFAPEGSLQYASRYAGRSTNEDRGLEVLLSPDGGLVYTVGWGWTPTSGNDYFVRAQDALTQDEAWVARFGFSSNDYARDAVLTPDGTRLFVVGQSWGGTPATYDYVTVAFDAHTGAQLWTDRYGGPANSTDEPLAVAYDAANDRVIVTGESYGGASNYDVATVAYDAATGARLWTQRHNGAGNGYDAGKTAAVSPDGAAVFVSADSWGGSGRHYDMVTLAYDAATGAPLWTTRYNASNEDRAVVSLVLPNGSLLVGGHGWGSTGWDVVLRALDPVTGDEQWALRWNGVGGGTDALRDVVLSPDGARLYVAAESWGGATWSDYHVGALDLATVAFEWTSRATGPNAANDNPQAIDVAPDGGRVYVTGHGPQSSTAGDAVTTAFDAATGKLEWAFRYNGPGNGYDNGRGIVVSPDSNRVYVAGDSWGSGTSYDAFTQAFHAFMVPGAPRGLWAASGAGAGEVTLAWTAPALDGGRGVTGYVVYRDGAAHATTTGTTFVDAGLAPGEAHAYAVAAVNGVGEGAATGSVAGEAFRLAGAPLGVAATPAARAITVAWDAPADDGGMPVEGYRVYRDGALHAEVDAATFELEDAGLAAGETHAYAVAAITAVGEGAASDPVEATTFLTPGAPTNVTARPGAGLLTVEVAWDAPEDDGGSAIVAYRVYRDGALVGEQPADNRTFVDGGLDPARAYAYAVAAVNAEGEGDASVGACTRASPWVDAPLLACEA